jgi:FtsZ-binding cell division protein ZapB
MPDAEGVWSQPAVGEDPAGVPSRGDAPGETAIGLDGELGLLEASVAEAADMVLRLREERAVLAGERETLLRECSELRRERESFRRDHDALRRERDETAARLTQIIAKVDALRGEP